MAALKTKYQIDALKSKRVESSNQISIIFGDICRNYHKGHENSKAANRSIAVHKRAMHEKIIAHITRMNGATCEEIEIALELSHQTASARCSELKAQGQIFEDGKRPTKSGRNAAILRVNDGKKRDKNEGSVHAA